MKKGATGKSQRRLTVPRDLSAASRRLFRDLALEYQIVDLGGREVLRSGLRALDQAKGRGLRRAVRRPGPVCQPGIPVLVIPLAPLVERLAGRPTCRQVRATLPARVAAWSSFRRQWVNRRCSAFVFRSPTLRFLALEGELGVTSVP